MVAVTSFASGPTTLPKPVLKAVSRDIREWRSSGQSVLTLPFTGSEFSCILDDAEQMLRALLAVPTHYRVLFLQGGAYAHFAMLPFNLANGCTSADYVEAGHWSRRAVQEAMPWIDVRLAGQGDGTSLPAPETWHLSSGAAYCHYTSNETADGLQYQTLPDTDGVPLVADMSADLLTRPVEVDRFGLIYASAQKNLGVAGLTLVIVRDDLLGRARQGTPAPFNYTLQARERSKVNTPPTFAIAVAARMMHWLDETGGVSAAGMRSRRKSAKLYAVIGNGGFYSSPLAVENRSLVSVRFHLPSKTLDDMFVDEAAQSGLYHLHGHPSVGGLRANLYNGVSEEAVGRLADFMIDFRRRRG